MDFLSNLASLALGEAKTINPSFTSISIEPAKVPFSESIITTEDSNSHEKLVVNIQDKISNNNEKSNNEVEKDNQQINPNHLDDLTKKNSFVDLISSDNEALVSYSLKINNEAVVERNSSVQGFEEPPKQQESDFASYENVIHKSLLINEEIEEKDKTILGLDKRIKMRDEESSFINRDNFNSVNESKSLQNGNRNLSTSHHIDFTERIKTPSVKINIGRVEIKAESPKQKIFQTTEPKKPKLSLDDYLKSFNKGK